MSMVLRTNLIKVNALHALGGLGLPKTVSPTGTVCAIQSYIKANTDGGGTVGAGYFKTENITAHQPTQQLATLMVRTTLNKNIFDAYGLQSHLLIAAEIATTDANAHLTAISGKVTLTSDVTKGWVNAGLFIVEGAGTVTPSASNMCHGVSIVCEAGVAGSIQSLLHLYSDSAIDAAIKTSGGTHMTYLIDIDGATGAAVVAAGLPFAHSSAGYISIKVGATAYAIPFVAVADMANS